MNIHVVVPTKHCDRDVVTCSEGEEFVTVVTMVTQAGSR